MPLCFCVGCLYASVTCAFGCRPEIDLYTDRVFIKTAGPCCFSIWPCIKTEEFVDILFAGAPSSHTQELSTLRSCVFGGDVAPPDKTIAASFIFAVSLPTEMMVGRQTSYFREAPALLTAHELQPLQTVFIYMQVCEHVYQDQVSTLHFV